MDNLLWSYPKGVFRCNEINLACRSTLIRDFLIPFWRATAGSQKDLLFFAAVGHRGQFHNSVQRYLSSFVWHPDVACCLPLAMAFAPRLSPEGIPKGTFQEVDSSLKRIIEGNLRTAWCPTTTTVSFLSSSMITGSIRATKSWGNKLGFLFILHSYLITFSIGISGGNKPFYLWSRFDVMYMTCRKTCPFPCFVTLLETYSKSNFTSQKYFFHDIFDIYMHLALISSMVRPEQSPASISFKVFHLKKKTFTF